MRPLLRAIAVAAVQVALIAVVGGTLLHERATLPRVWIESAGVDPELPIRGRYVRLNLLVPAIVDEAVGDESQACGRLEVRDGQAVAILEDPADAVSGVPSACFARQEGAPGDKWLLLQSVAFFLGEDASDPTVGRAPGELWVEVTLPEGGRPRPIRLGLMRDGVIQTLEP